MKLYETVFIARQDMSPAQVETLTEKFANVITQNGGTVGKMEYCGLKDLEYLIKKNRKGHYVLMNITAPSDALQEMERQMRINEDILRYLSVAVDVHETGPSVLLKSNRYSRDEGYQNRNHADHDNNDNDQAESTSDESETSMNAEGAN